MSQPLPAAATSPASPLAPPCATRLTRNDQKVLALLHKVERPLKAYEILERLRDQGINAPMTVYRSLGRLSERGIVRKIESINAYFALPEGDEAFGAFLLCSTCGMVGYRALDRRSVEQLVGGDVRLDSAAIELTIACIDGKTGLADMPCAAATSQS